MNKKIVGIMHKPIFESLYPTLKKGSSHYDDLIKVKKKSVMFLGLLKINMMLENLKLIIVISIQRN